MSPFLTLTYFFSNLGLIVYVLGPSSSILQLLEVDHTSYNFIPNNAHQRRSKLNSKMWLEALPPFIIIAGCITVTGIGLGIVDRWAHRGKVSLVVEEM